LRARADVWALIGDVLPIPVTFQREGNLKTEEVAWTEEAAQNEGQLLKIQLR
jgi:hypothetical protein